MLEKSFGLLFYLKQPKNQRRKDRFVYLRITVDGKSKELSTKRKWLPERWNQDSGIAAGTKEDARSLNDFLESLKAKVYEAKKLLLDTGKRVTADLLKNLITGTGPERRKILEIFRKHLQVMNSLKNIEFKPATIQRYQTAFNHLSSFIKFKLEIDDHNTDYDLDLHELTHAFIKEYYYWLRGEKKHSYNSAVKYLSLLKSITIQCRRNGWLYFDPFADFKTNPKDIPVTPLRRKELEAIKAKTFSTERLTAVRDMFVFSCYTGLAHTDIKHLNSSQIVLDDDGKKWIMSAREKNDNPIKVPLLKIPNQLLEKYAQHPKCIESGKAFPVPSNQKTNEYLKEIAALCGINRRLTYHIARHTFATTVALRNGVPIESVSGLLSHKTLKQTLHYAKVIDEKLAEDMDKLEQKLETLEKQDALRDNLKLAEITTANVVEHRELDISVAVSKTG